MTWVSAALIGALAVLSCVARAADGDAPADAAKLAAEARRLMRAEQRANRLFESVNENFGDREKCASSKETLEKAMALAPDNFTIVMRGGMMLRYLGYHADAARVLENAVLLGKKDYEAGEDDYVPLISLSHEWLGEIYQFYLGDPDAAELHCLAALEYDIEVERRSKINGNLFCIYINWENKFDREKLQDHFIRQLFTPADTRTSLHFAILLAVDGQTERARAAAAIMEETGLAYESSYVVVAYPYALIGDNDAALRCLERGLEGQWESLGHYPGPDAFLNYTAWLRNVYALKNLRDDERFEALFDRFDARARDALEENGDE